MKHLIILVMYLSIYQAPSDKTKSVIECSWDDGRPDKHLVVDNKDLDLSFVDEWVLKECR